MQELIGQHLDQITAFITVAEQGSFAAAARILGKDASVLSKRVTALEERLGIRLLERSTRSLALTEIGKRYCHRMKTLLHAMAEAEAEASTQSLEPRGTLRLALPLAFGRQWIAPILPDFLALYPQLNLDVTYADHYVDLLAENMDLAIRIGELPDSSLVARKLADHRRVVCATPAYLNRHGQPDRPEDLQNHNCLHFTHMVSYPHWRFQRGGEERSVRVSGNYQANDANSLIQAVLADQGLTVVSDWLVGPDLAEGRLVNALPGWQLEGEGAIYLVRPSNRFEAGKTKVFVDWLTGKMTPLPWGRQ